MIKEAVKEAIQDELKEILLEAIKSPKQMITENQNISTPTGGNGNSTPQLSSTDTRQKYMEVLGETALSFNSNYLDIVNRIQHFTPTPKQSFKYFQSMLPDYFRFQKWIKGKKPNSFNKDLLNIVSNHLECSNQHAEEYLNILDKKELKNLLNHLGIQEDQIKKLLKK